MPWTKAARIQYQRGGLRYTSDLTDAEWALIARMMPPRRDWPAAGGQSARDRAGDLRITLSSGCQWRALPKEFPPYSTMQGYFTPGAIRVDGSRSSRPWFGRRAEGSDESPNRQLPLSIVEPHLRRRPAGHGGFDAGKRLHGRKRHIVTDTNGLLLAAYVHPANIQDVHGAVPLLESLRGRFPKLEHVFADRIYRGKQLLNALSDCGPWTIEIVERPPGVKGFQLLPRRWVVERTFAWFGRCRRLSKDFEGSAATELAWLLAAHLRLLTRRLARP